MYCVCVTRCTQLTSVIKNKIRGYSQNLICHEISYLYSSKYTVFENVPLSCITNLVCKRPNELGWNFTWLFSKQIF